MCLNRIRGNNRSEKGVEGLNLEIYGNQNKVRQNVKKGRYMKVKRLWMVL